MYNNTARTIDTIVYIDTCKLNSNFHASIILLKEFLFSGAFEYCYDAKYVKK